MQGNVDTILYIETTIPPRMTAAEYRRARCSREKPRLRSRVLKRHRRPR